MKQVIAAMLAFSLASCAAGPHLGNAMNVIVTETGDDKPGSPYSDCSDFKLSPRHARTFLNRATIVTGYEVHDLYAWSPCYVKGTATFRGFPATWEIRKFGTGYVSLMSTGEFVYEIVDERHASRDDVSIGQE